MYYFHELFCTSWKSIVYSPDAFLVQESVVASSLSLHITVGKVIRHLIK